MSQREISGVCQSPSPHIGGIVRKRMSCCQVCHEREGGSQGSPHCEGKQNCRCPGAQVSCSCAGLAHTGLDDSCDQQHREEHQIKNALRVGLHRNPGETTSGEC